MAVLKVKNGPNKGQTFEVRDEVIRLGRDPGETIQINDQGVSRHHSEVFKIGDMSFIRDLGSTNGTFVNEIKIGEELLRPGDQIRIGLTVLAFEDQLAELEEVQKRVEFETHEAPPEAGETTIELRLDRKAELQQKIGALGQEMDSQHLATLYEVARIIGSEKSLDGLLAKVTELTVEAIHADNGYVFMFEKTTGKLLPKAVVEKMKGGAKISRTIVKRVMTGARAVLTSDAGADSRFSSSQSIVMKSIKSVICAPLVSMDQTIGVMYLHSSNPIQPFTSESLELATATAIQLGMAITTFTASERARKTFSNAVKGLVVAMEMSDPKRKGHSERVANYAVAIAQQMNLPPDEIHRLYLAAYLHDIGKIGARETVAPGQDPAKVKAEHVLLGEKFLSSLEGFEDLLPAIKFHHEKLDGTGFPAGAQGNDIPLMGRILCVANDFDNMTSSGGMDGLGSSTKDALLTIGKRGGFEYDDKVVEALLLANKKGSLFTGGKTEAP